MDPIIIENIPFQLNVDELAQKLRIKARASYLEDFKHLCSAAQSLAKPKAYYRLSYIDARGDDYVILDGVRLSSRILKMNLDQTDRAFVYVATCGRELEAWANSFDNLLWHFWADALSEEALHAASNALSAHVARQYRPGRTSHMNPGSLPDWPLEEQRPLFGLLGDVESTVGVQLTDSLLMLPRKSVSGIEFATEVNFASCQLCPREVCPNRRAGYDPELYLHYAPAAAPLTLSP